MRFFLYFNQRALTDFQALSYLPLRFFLYFSHAGVFLLKAAVIVPLPASQKRAILRLIRALTKCMATASSDPKHPGVRYSSALHSLLGRIYRDQDLQTPSLTRPSSPRPTADTSLNWSDSMSNNLLASIGESENSLPALLGNRESSFVPEQPFQGLASDIDALFGLASEESPLNSGGGGPLPSEPFVSLFGNYDREFWEPFTSGVMDWNMV